MHNTSYCGRCNSVQSCDTSLWSLSILATSRSRSAVSSCTISSIKPHTCFNTTPNRATRWSPTMPISSHRDLNWPIEASIRACISSVLSDSLQHHVLISTDIQLLLMHYTNHNCVMHTVQHHIRGSVRYQLVCSRSGSGITCYNAIFQYILGRQVRQCECYDGRSSNVWVESAHARRCRLAFSGFGKTWMSLKWYWLLNSLMQGVDC